MPQLVVSLTFHLKTASLLTINKSSCCLLLSHVQLFATPWTAARQASLSFRISQNLLKLMFIESAMLSNHLFLCHPLLLLPSIFPSMKIFSKELAKVLELQLQHQSFQWIFRVDFLEDDWFDLFAVQGTLKSLLQHYSLKASVLQHSAFYIVQLSHPYITTGKTTALTRWTFVSKECLCCLICCLVLSLLFFQGASIF